MIGGIAGRILGAAGGVNAIWSGVQSVLNMITGQSAQVLGTAPDPSLQSLSQSLMPSGVLQSIAAVRANQATDLIYADWATQQANDPSLTETQDAGNIETAEQEDQAVAVSAGGPTVELEVDPTPTIPTLAELFSTVGAPLAIVVTNTESSSTAMSYGDNGVVL